jgi:hypothetical protein
MLKKIQNVWNFIIKKKKQGNNLNLYSIKNNFLFTNAIGSSLVFYLLGLRDIKLKKIQTVVKKINFLNLYKFFYIIIIILWLSAALLMIFYY